MRACVRDRAWRWIETRNRCLYAMINGRSDRQLITWITFQIRSNRLKKDMGTSAWLLNMMMTLITSQRYALAAATNSYIAIIIVQ